MVSSSKITFLYDM